MVYVTILVSETLRCWDFFFFSYCRKRQERIKVPTWQQAEELWDRLHEQHHLPRPLWPVWGRCHS